MGGGLIKIFAIIIEQQSLEHDIFIKLSSLVIIRPIASQSEFPVIQRGEAWF